VGYLLYAGRTMKEMALTALWCLARNGIILADKPGCYLGTKSQTVEFDEIPVNGNHSSF
jgi:hypothetical protein